MQSNQTIVIAIIAVVGLFCTYFIVRYIIRQLGKRNFCKLTETLKQQVKDAKQELETMFFPLHLVV